MIELLNIDCMEYMATLPDKAFDLAIVDPPYGLKSTNFVTQRLKIREDKQWNNKIPGPEYFTELHRISKHQIIWGCNYYAKFIPAVGRIVHDKKMTRTGPMELSDCDLASQSFNNLIRLFTYEWRGNVQNGTINWKNNGIDGRIHPTQKPVALYRWCLQEFATGGGRILDTHLGSGSSAIAAHQMGFDFVGCELDKDYYNATCKRFKEQTMQQQLFK